MSDAQRELLRVKFLERENSLSDLLSDQQRMAMQTMRYHLAIAKHGLAKVLEAHLLGDELELSPQQIAQVVANSQVAKKQLQGTMLELLKEANLEIVNALPGQLQEQLQAIVDKEGMEKVLHSPLFIKEKPIRRKSLPQASALQRYLKKSSVQDELEIEASVVEQIQLKIEQLSKSELDERQLWTVIQDAIESDTFDSLVKRIVLDQCQYFGTINALSIGIVGHDYSWEESDRDEFHKSCEQVHQEYLAKLQRAKFAAIVQSFESLPGRMQDQVGRLLGGADLPLLDSSFELFQ